MKPIAEDLDQLMAVMEAAFDSAYGEAWTLRQVQDALLIGNCHYCLIGRTGEVLKPGEEAAGFYLCRTAYEDEELLLFAVRPEHRRQGIGRILLEILTKSARSRGIKRLFLEMRRGNTAEFLYRNFGFIPVGERPNYYRGTNGEKIDAITFAIDLA